jgi:hypothetical protein
VAGHAFHPREKFSRKFKVVLPEKVLFGMVGVAGGKAKGIFQDELESGARSFWDVQKDNHDVAPKLEKAAPQRQVENKTFTFRRRRQNGSA